MLKKSLISLSLACAVAITPIMAKENVQILAQQLNHKENIIQASGDVLIFSPTYYITAKEVIYNKEKKTLELFNDVNVLKNNELLTVSDYAFIDFENDTSINKPILMLDKKTNLWINAKKSEKKQETHYFQESTLSSCDCDAPLWSIGFSSGDYNTKEKWVNTYNSRLYLGSVPIFYTPWLGFTTDNTRRSGLLRPTIGYAKKEGFLYSQPIFIAPKKDWDVLLTPQIRANRGAGAYVEYRYIDTQYSSLKVKTGYFKEQSNYQTENNIANSFHRGFDIEYKRTNIVPTIFNDKDVQDGLIISLHDLNDIGYESLEDVKDSNTDLTGTNLTSRINYFYNTNNFYSSAELKYFNDTTLTSNSTVLQQLPKLKYHSYSQEILEESNVLFSTDLAYSRYTRDSGINGDVYNITVPFSYNFTLLNDFITVSLKEQFIGNFINYSGDNSSSYENGRLLENQHIATVSTDLIKPYDDFIHTFNLQSTITIPNTIKEKGDIYYSEDDPAELEPFAVTKSSKQINFTINQSLYDREDLKQIVNHKLSQSIIYNSSNSTLLNLKNDLMYYYTYGTISNKLVYDHQDSIITESTTTIKYKYDKFFFNSTYSDIDDLQSLNVELGNSFNRYYTFKYKENYDLDASISNLKEYSVSIDKNCWSLSLKLADSLVTAPTTTNSAVRQDIVYLEFEMKPIGGIKEKFVQDEEQQ